MLADVLQLKPTSDMQAKYNYTMTIIMMIQMMIMMMIMTMIMMIIKIM